jgi:hypothetical protein
MSFTTYAKIKQSIVCMGIREVLKITKTSILWEIRDRLI